MINQIFDKNGDIIAIYVSDVTLMGPGINFLTNESDSLQLGVFAHPKDHQIRRHWHPDFVRNLNKTSEVLFVVSGSMSVDIYNQDLTPNQTLTLASGGLIALFSGGHGFKILEPSHILEVKQGPYAGNDDKILF